MTVLGIIVSLAAHAAAGQLRFFHGVSEIVAVRTQTGHASAVAARVLWGISARNGDLVIAQDSVVQAHVTIGTAVTCAAGIGVVTIAPRAPAGHTLTTFLRPIGEGDRVHIYLADTLGSGWITAHVVALAGASHCERFDSPGNALTLYLREPLAIPAGAMLRFTRPARMSIYRASDRRWYLGMRDWRGSDGTFTTIQPVAGPLEPFSADRAATGLRFAYLDEHGIDLGAVGNVNPERVRAISVLSRGKSAGPVRLPGKKMPTDMRHVDSSIATVSLK
jgi:hypothetical protein